jgi:hypothetical protein
MRRPTNAAYPAMSPFGNHLTCPFRIMFTVHAGPGPLITLCARERGIAGCTGFSAHALLSWVRKLCPVVVRRRQLAMSR